MRYTTPAGSLFRFLLAISIMSLAMCSSPTQNPSETPTPVKNPVIPPTFLAQGWNGFQRDVFYNTSQGSQMMPLDWFLSVERADSEELFTSDQLARYGYLPNPKGYWNPWGLPVGFTQDPADPEPGQPPAGGRWVGLTCAACHTNQINYVKDGKTVAMQIDGGPADADLYKFLSDLSLALKATLDNEAKFNRFAGRVGAKDEKAQRDLRNELTRFSAYFSTLVNASTPPHAWGPSRTDAFGMIFNRASAIDLSDNAKWAWFRALERNNQPPNAPVSYPYLYNVSRLNKVQWNGVAENKKWYQRLGRNVVEVIGVFARINADKFSAANLNPGYPSTVNVVNQLIIEELLLSQLQSPQWPQNILPPINQDMADKGKVLYNQYCAKCHAVIDRNGTSTVNVDLSPLDKVGTDPLMATNVSCRKVDTGVLVGSKEPPVIGTPLANPDYVLNLAANLGTGAIIQAPLQIINDLTSSLQDSSAKKYTANADKGKEYTGKIDTTKIPDIKKLSRKDLKEHPAFNTLKANLGECDATPEVYIGRPLAGIWASAPYLHNGSVPSLYQLMLPEGQRVSKFKVGSRNFDPVNVGFDINAGSFEFDTSLPGNSNKGHTWGTELTDDQRRQLVEYMKSL